MVRAGNWPLSFRAMGRPVHVFGIALVLLWPVALAAEESLCDAIEKVAAQPHYKHAQWGALFVDLNSGEVLFERDGDKLFVPASTTKLFSTAFALDALGADYRFQTPVVRRGEIQENGELAGDLILVASGDLSFGGRTTPDGKIAFTNADHTYANGNPDAELTEPDPLGGLNELARQVAAAGIKRVRGDVLIDDCLFEKAESSGSGPGRVAPCTVNDNVVDIVITPSEAGQLAKWTSRPVTAAIQIESKVETADASKPLEIVLHDLGRGRILVSGQIPQGHKPVLKIHEAADSTAFVRSLFIEALQRSGVFVNASALSDGPSGFLPSAAEVKALPRVALLASPPFSESVKLILKVSHNLHASTLPLLVASKYGERTLAAGLKRQHGFLEQAGVDVNTISFAGAAGGARGDFITPRSAIQLLKYMANRPDFALYRDALPRLGVDGTLAKNIAQDSPAHDKVQAKTGTLYTDNAMNGTTLMTSKALSGYMSTAKGRTLAFAIFVNNAHLREGVTTKTFGDDLGRICEIVYLHE